MAQAKYTIFCPDFVASAVLQHLQENGKRYVLHASLRPGHPDCAVVAYCEESPEIDSLMKEVGTNAAEASNVEYVSVVKEGKAGVNVWQMRNKYYMPTTVHEDLSQSTSPEVNSPPGLAAPPL